MHDDNIAGNTLKIIAPSRHSNLKIALMFFGTGLDIVLSRRLSSHNHYPAIDVLESISRLMGDVVPQEQVDLAMRFKDILATYREAEDLINIGAYAEGSNPKIDLAIQKIDEFNRFLRQSMKETASMEESVAGLKAVVEGGP